MRKNDDQLHRIKREAFGKMADRAEIRVVGSGVSAVKRVALNLEEDPAHFFQRASPWTENRNMIVTLFADTFQRSLQCPGRGKPECCQAAANIACFPNWREREDPEWYALEINKYLGLVDGRLKAITPVTAALAVDEAFELGCLLTEALIKFKWDRDAKRGQKTIESAREGGQMRRAANRKRKSTLETVEAVDRLLREGASKKTAYGTVAEQQGLSDQTIAKEYRNAIKER